MVEQMVPGDDHRLMVIGGKLVAAIRREASCVVGDGNSTIGQLIDRLNAERSSNIVKSRYRRPVALDDALANHLAKQGVGMDSVPAAGARIRLRSNSNVSTGGVAFDVTDQVHPTVTALAEQLAVTVGLQTAGLDYLTTDITRSPARRPWRVHRDEYDAGDGCAGCGRLDGRKDRRSCAGRASWPDSGRAVGVAEPGIGSRAPADRGIRGPLRPRPGSADSELRVGPLDLRMADTAPWAAVRSALRNKSVTSLRIVCTVDEILANGLPVDRVDRVRLDGVSLPERWQKVIERSAGAFEMTDRPSLP